MRKHEASRRGGFTLVELLVVIGIIALLISILLPTLARAREQANSLKCMSNLRQIGAAFVMYTQANKGALPTSGALVQSYTPTYALVTNSYGNSWIQQSSDWMFWGTNPNLKPAGMADADYNLSGSRIAAYIARPLQPDVFRCPSDDGSRTRSTQYSLSYVLNCYICADNFARTASDYQTLMVQPVDRASKISQVKNPSGKALLFEEDSVTLDDSFGTPDYIWPSYSPSKHADTNLLSVRHSLRKWQRDPLTASTSLVTTLTNPNLRGNVAFCDGSVRSMTRAEFHRPSVCCPRWPDFNATKSSDFAKERL